MRTATTGDACKLSLTVETQVHDRMILKISTNARSVNTHIDIQRLEELRRANTTDLKQAWCIYRAGCQHNVRRGDRTRVRLRVTAGHLDARSCCAIALELDHGTEVSDQEMQVGSVCYRLVVRRCCGRSVSSNATDGLGCEDDTSMGAVVSLSQRRHT